jgi:glycerol-3-phosphate acyltransferase PlsY
MMGLLAALLVSYLWGSIPTAYLAARTRGVDLRRFGSGNVGSSNLRRVIGRFPAALVGLSDVLKGALPVFLAYRAGWDVTAAGLLGLATVCGHNWPVYLRFKGGRGLAATLGVLFILAPWSCIPILAGLALGTIIGRVALGAGAGLILIPLIGFAAGQAEVLQHVLLAMVGVAFFKRLVANGEYISRANWKRVLVNRLLYDRDVDPEEEWTERRHAAESSKQ